MTFFLTILLLAASVHASAQPKEPPMSDDCSALLGFLAYLEQQQSASLDAIAAEAHRSFPGAAVENRNQRFVLAEFKTSFACHRQVTSAWGQPREISAPPSPPPLGPHQGVISPSGIEDDPFHWMTQTYWAYGRTLRIGTDGERIKSLRIDPSGER
jgi:hypothetical protein